MITNRIINGIGHVFLDDEIGINGISGGEIARQIMDFKANGLHVIVNINSPGGSVFDGFQIIDAIIQTNADTHISGMAASIAGIIALFGHNVTANDFSILMIHGPKGANDDLLNIVKKRLKKILIVKSRFHEDEVNEMLSDGKDHFFDAQEAFEKGLLTSEPIDTGKRVPLETSLLNITEQFQVYNKLTNQLDMKEVINKLQLKETASEQDVLNKIESLEKKASDALEMVSEVEKEKTEMKNKLDELQKQLDKASESCAEILIESAVKAGKINEKETEGWNELAVSDYAKAESLIKGIVLDHSSHVVVTSASKKTESDEDLTKSPEKLREFMRNATEVRNLLASDPKKLETYQEAYLNLV